MNSLSENGKGKQPLQEASDRVRNLARSSEEITNRGVPDVITSVQQRSIRFCDPEPSEIKLGDAYSFLTFSGLLTSEEKIDLNVCNPCRAASDGIENSGRSVSTVKRGICQLPNLDLSPLPPREPMRSLPYQRRDEPAFTPQQSSTHGTNQPPCAQLTIFYAGKVMVFDVSAEKAKDIMLVASRISGSPGSWTPSSSFSSAPPTPLKSTPHRITTFPPPVAMDSQNYSVRLIKNIAFPMSKKFSIQRFLEKRDGKLGGKVPYTRPAQN